MKNEIKTDRLLSCRQKSGLTQQKAAELIGVTQPAYQRYEAGTRVPSVQTIKEMARVFATSVDYLTGESDLSEADLIIISKNETPLLYSVVKHFQGCTDAQLKHLMKYYSELSSRE